MPKITGINSSGTSVGNIVSTLDTHTTPPVGYLYCDGSTLSKTTYAALYAKLAGKVTETSTTFNLPDLRGRFLRSLDTTAATIDPDKATRTGGDANKLGSTQADALLKHTHALTLWGAWGDTPGGVGGGKWARDNGDQAQYTNTTDAMSTGTTENRPKNFAVNYFIAYM